MTQPMEAEVKISQLLDLLRTSGGLEIEAKFSSRHSHDKTNKLITLVELSGPDQPLLLRNDAEVLQAIQHLASSVLRLGPSAADLLRIEAEHTRADKTAEMQRLAESGIEAVLRTSQPYSFPPMTSWERRLLHLALAASGLRSASTGHSATRCVVLYPEGMEPPAEQLRSPGTPEPQKRQEAAA